MDKISFHFAPAQQGAQPIAHETDQDKSQQQCDWHQEHLHYRDTPLAYGEQGSGKKFRQIFHSDLLS
jgi:hypothetical protein